MVMDSLSAIMYGDTHSTGTTAPPIQLKYTIGLDRLCLLWGEYEKLVARVFSIFETNGLTMCILDTVRNAIFNVTLGHPGITRGALDLIQGKYRRGLRHTLGILRLLVSPCFREIM